MAKKKEEKKVEMTRAQKTEATKSIIKELLAIKPMKHNELIDETAKLYTQRYKSEETENVNDVKGRAGSVLDIMKKESEVMYEGGMYALKARMPVVAPEEPKAKKTMKAKTKKPEPKAEETAKEEPQKEEAKEEKPAPKKRGRAKKTEEVKAEVKEETPAPTPAVEEKKEEAEEKPVPKKRGRKPKAKVEEPTPAEETKTEEPKTEVKEEPAASIKTEEKQEEPKVEVKEETPPQKAEEPKEEPKKEQTALTVKPKAEIAQKSVMDMSFLIGGVKEKPAKAETPKPPVKEEKKAPVSEMKAETTKKAEEKKEAAKPAPKPEKQPIKQQGKPTPQQPQKQENKAKQSKPEKKLTEDEKLRDAFLKRMRSLGGDYFEYYSVYLLERYSMKNGRRLEGLKISGGDRDGGIDGEIELTDKFGFKETIYIQSKNWDPDKGKEEYWVVGETLLQQFIGACACKQAKDGKQHCRGIFVTTSRFTPDAKRILDDMSDKIVGYDGNDLYETAKECEFGLIKKNGEWVLDEKLLSGTKAFFNMF